MTYQSKKRNAKVTNLPHSSCCYKQSNPWFRIEASLHLRWFSGLQIWSVRRERQKSIYCTANRIPAFQSVASQSISGMIICCDFDAHVPVWQLAGSWRGGGRCVLYGGSVGFWEVDRTQKVSAPVRLDYGSWNHKIQHFQHSVKPLQETLEGMWYNILTCSWII